MRMPSKAAIDTAFMWLNLNEGPPAELKACQDVAAWIDHLAIETQIRRIARASGVTTAVARRKLSERVGGIL